MSEPLPLWLSVYTRRVLRPFISTLARSHKWSAIYLVSPWISPFGMDAGMTFEQLLKRLRDDDATAYVVTRPPTENWHSEAVSRLAETRQANIKFVEELHTKLYCAKTAQADFALFGSANLTQNALDGRELSVLVTASGAGRTLVRILCQEAAEIYRLSGKLHCKRGLGGR